MPAGAEVAGALVVDALALATLAVEIGAAEVMALEVGALMVFTALTAPEVSTVLLPVVATVAAVDPPQFASVRSGPVRSALPNTCRNKRRRDVTAVERGEAISELPSGTA